MEFILGLKENNSSEPEKYFKALFSLNDSSSENISNIAKINELSQITTSNKTATNEDHIQSANLIDSLVGDFTVNNSTKSYNTTISINSDGTLQPQESIICNDKYCSDKGKCVFSDEFKHSAICNCQEGYTGTYCQMTSVNSALIKNYTINALDSIQKSLSEPNTVRDSNTGATVVVDSPKEIPTSLIKAVKLNIANGVKAIENVEDANKFNDVIKTILDNNNPKSTENVVKSKDDILDMISNMFDFSKDQLQKTKTLTPTKRINNNRILSFFEDSFRTLQNTNNDNSTLQEIYQKKVDLILNHENTKKLIENFASNFAQHFKNQFSKILDSKKNDSLSVLNSQNITEFIVERDNIHFTLMLTPIIDINSFNFIKYFSKRAEAKLSYIDPKKCLQTLVNSYTFKEDKKSEDDVLNKVIFSLFIQYKEPMFQISNELSKHAITKTHNLILFDISGNKLILNNCLDEIMHYIPMAPTDPTFIERYNKNPKKYEIFKTDNITSINQINDIEYMPIYIFKNGTVEKQYSIEEQIEKYYPTYKFYLSKYDVTNITIHNITIDFDKIFVNLGDDSIKEIKDSQLIAASRNLGNMAVMAYYDPPTKIIDKYYFLKNDNILKRSSNWEGNWCFITLTILFAINFIFIILTMIFGCLTPKFVSKDNEVFINDLFKYENEYQMAKIDDLIFDPSLNILRNNIYGYLYNAEPVNNSKEPHLGNLNAENNNPEQGIELQNVKVEMKENENHNADSASKSVKSRKEIKAPNTNSLIHFIFKRNIYANLLIMNSPFNPAWKFFIKFFTLINLLLFFCTCMFIYSGIDFDPNETINYGAIVQSIFLSILISNVGFTIINLFYSSMIHSGSISHIIKADFKGDEM